MYDATISLAIAECRLLSIRYGGRERTVEPYVYGSYGGSEQLLGYQVGGYSSSGGLPDWRRFHLRKITSMEVLDETFLVRRDHDPINDAPFDTIYAAVQ